MFTIDNVSITKINANLFFTFYLTKKASETSNIF